jgi:hydroxyethylthiazole kinase-like sugar kinase family protein
MIHRQSLLEPGERNGEDLMKSIVIAAGVLLAATALSPAPAAAAGCLKGAVVGGVAGHFMHRHGVLGATAGCLVGRHEANKQARQQAQQNQTANSNYNSR